MARHKKKTVGIVGCGITGGALYKYFENQNTNIHINRVDPALGYNDNLKGCDYVFVCVPTPVLRSGEQDTSYLWEAIYSIPEGIPLIIRSTILPGTTNKIALKTGRSVAHMPEFLTERRATLDMFEHKWIFLGAENFTMNKWGKLSDLFPDKMIIPAKSVEAEMIKYFHNCFGALKVTYFNAIHHYCLDQGGDYETVRTAILQATSFINEEHTRVPGPDGKMGYGGRCFPDNVRSLAKHTENHIIGSLMKFVDRANGLWRQE